MTKIMVFVVCLLALGCPKSRTVSDAEPVMTETDVESVDSAEPVVVDAGETDVVEPVEATVPEISEVPELQGDAVEAAPTVL